MWGSRLQVGIAFRVGAGVVFMGWHGPVQAHNGGANEVEKGQSTAIQCLGPSAARGERRKTPGYGKGSEHLPGPDQGSAGRGLAPLLRRAGAHFVCERSVQQAAEAAFVRKGETIARGTVPVGVDGRGGQGHGRCCHCNRHVLQRHTALGAMHPAEPFLSGPAEATAAGGGGW